ncbi:MAG: hypothetical protein V4562_00955 [Pseudomonadota bacterium]
MRFIKTTLWAAGAFLTGCVQAPPPAPATPPTTAEPVLTLPDPALRPARTWDEYKVRAAKRVVQNNEAQMFTGKLPDRLRSIPVLQVQLNRDGSVRNIVVLRTPRFSPETIKMATAAVRKAAPFEPVGNLPQPWQFNETFLYNDQLKFQLRSLVEIP